MMRTTVTLDADVEQLLRDAMQQQRQSFKETLNRAIRSGLTALNTVTDDAAFVVHPRRMGLRPGIDSSRLNQLSDEMEAESLDDITHRLVEKNGGTRSRKRK